MTQKKLTVFTPTYNRKHTIGRTYESLCRQTSKDFEWLIIDDGSTDNTKDLVMKWIGDNIISIRYIYQKNQGMHGAHNTAYRNIFTELNTCIDSDDYMPDDAVEKIISFWNKYGSKQYAGIVGLDINSLGNVIGTSFPKEMKVTALYDFYRHGRGDKKLVYRTDIIKQYPEYPIFEGEKYVGLSYKYLLIDQKYKLLTLNSPLVIVDYQMDGSSKNMYKQYWNNPKGFIFIRKIDMLYMPSLYRRLKACIHYVSSSIRCGNTRMIKESPRPLLTFLAVPFGILLYFYIRYKVNVKNK